MSWYEVWMPGTLHRPGAVTASKMLATAVGLVAAVALTVPSPARGQGPPSCLRYAPRKVELRGRLTTERHYGSPGFGESPQTDKKVETLVLLLSHPVDVCGDSESVAYGGNYGTYRNVTRVQLVVPRGFHVEGFGDEDVLASGTLFEKFTMHHYTDVLMMVETIHGPHTGVHRIDSRFSPGLDRPVLTQLR